jgi:hypothetical protein
MVAEAVVRDAQRLSSDMGKRWWARPPGVLVAAQKLHKLLPGHGWNEHRRNISVTNRHYV